MELSLTEAELQRVSDLAALFFTPAEIAMMLGYNKASFVAACKLEDSPVYNAFYGARLTEEMLVRKSVITLAKQGSSPAQTLAKKILEESNAKMLDR